MGDMLVTVARQFGEVLLPPLATAIAGLLVAYLAKALKKAGLELTNAQDERLRQLVRDGILAAEEAARRNPNLTSVEKKAIAVNQAVARAPSVKVETASRVVDQVLPEVRAQLRDSPRPATPASFGRPKEA